MSDQNKEGLISSVIYQNHQPSTDVDVQGGVPVNNAEIETRFVPPREDKNLYKVVQNQVSVNSDDTESVSLICAFCINKFNLKFYNLSFTAFQEILSLLLISDN